MKNPEVVYCRLENELKIPYKPLVPSTTDDMTQIGSFPVEDIPATMDFDEELNSLVGQYYYIYDWVLYRKYDALRQEWGDIVGHSGHAGWSILYFQIIYKLLKYNKLCINELLSKG